MKLTAYLQLKHLNSPKNTNKNHKPVPTPTPTPQKKEGEKNKRRKKIPHLQKKKPLAKFHAI